MKYRREIDGLRALAVVPVILFHAGFETFSGGFVGVDVFFVISGYLITTIILTELEQDKFSIVNFYERRARRILPALFLVMLVCIPFAWFWLLPNAMKDFSQSLVAVSVFASNILFWRESGYFDGAAELKPLLHTWSLAVEEQYYLIFPLFLMLTWRLGKRWILVLLVAVFLASFATAQWASIAKPTAAFYLLPTRGWELLIGAFAAFYLSKSNRTEFARSVGEVCGWLGLALILYAVFAYSKTTPFPGVYALAPTVGTVLIILFATQQTTIGQFVGNKAFVGVGLISYSAYLWHQPLFAFAREKSLTEPSQLVFGVLSLAALVLAYFTWRFVEAPFRKKGTFNRFKIFLYASIASIFFIAFGLVGNALDGEFVRLGYDDRYKPLVERLRSNHGLNKECEEKLTESEKCITDDEPEVLLWGDSFAMHLAQGFLASNSKIKMKQTTVSQCAPVLGLAPTKAIFGAKNCLDGNDFVIKMLEKNKSIKYVVLSSPAFFIGQKNLVTREGIKELSDKEVEAYFVATLEKIKKLGVIPVIFSPPPRNGSDIGQCLLKAEIKNVDKSVCDFPLSESEEYQKPIKNMLRRLSSNYQVIWLEDGVCKDGICTASIDDKLIYRDTGHLSYEGSALLGNKMNFYDLLK
jgi:peptidoglycan/LPS O-acetylase OafA/YrhL